MLKTEHADAPRAILITTGATDEARIIFSPEKIEPEVAEPPQIQLPRCDPCFEPQVNFCTKRWLFEARGGGYFPEERLMRRAFGHAILDVGLLLGCSI